MQSSLFDHFNSDVSFFLTAFLIRHIQLFHLHKNRQKFYGAALFKFALEMWYVFVINSMFLLFCSSTLVLHNYNYCKYNQFLSGLNGTGLPLERVRMFYPGVQHLFLKNLVL
jgi:hypothetical protein